MSRLCTRCHKSINREDDEDKCNSCAMEVDGLKEDNRWCDCCQDDVTICGHWTADHAVEEDFGDVYDNLVHPDDEHFSRPEMPTY